MENLLRKRLSFIKARAERLREVYLARRGLAVEDLGPPVSLGEALAGSVRSIASEPFYLVRGEADADMSDVAKRFYGLTPYSLSFLVDDAAKLTAQSFDASRACFFDIETTGLAPNTYVFLCGFMYLEGGRFVVEQVLAREYAEELGLLLYTHDVLRRYPFLITYNGLHFDVPFIETRMAVGRVDRDARWKHLDAYEGARRALGGILPNLKLTTIERHLRKITRTGDIPGAEIPAVYHDFVRTGDARRMKRVMYHNRMDLIATACLFDYLATGNPSAPPGPLFTTRDA